MNPEQNPPRICDRPDCGLARIAQMVELSAFLKKYRNELMPGLWQPIDIDLSGCYGEGSRKQLYPFVIDTEYTPITDGGSLVS